MKTLSLSLVVFAAICLLSSALPKDKEKDGRKSLTESEFNEDGKFLQRRKPPGKIPGPKLTSGKEKSEVLSDFSSEAESKMKRLSDGEKEKKKKKDVSLSEDKKHPKNKDLAPLGKDSKEREKGKDKKSEKGDESRTDSKEETQEERSSLL